jgi:hypothetical protein
MTSKQSVIVSIFVSCALFFCNCDNEETHYAIIPSIEYKSIEFIEVGTIADPDALNLSLYFTDGDMDLGRSFDRIGRPYQPFDFFVEANGSMSKTLTDMDRPAYMQKPKFTIGLNNSAGKLVTNRTRVKPGFEFLPDYKKSCDGSYYIDTVLINDDSKSIIDETFNIVDTIHMSGQQDVYLVKDTLYYELNEWHYDILIDFLVKESNGSFTLFDFQKEFCVTYDGVFPELDQLQKGADITSGPFNIIGLSKNRGILTYSMIGSGFKSIFADKTLSLKSKFLIEPLTKAIS